MECNEERAQSDISKAMACFIGCAIGDALGAHTEFKTIDYQRTNIKQSMMCVNMLLLPLQTRTMD